MKGIYLPMESDAGLGDIKPASRIVIQNRQTSYPSRCPMYGQAEMTWSAV